MRLLNYMSPAVSPQRWHGGVCACLQHLMPFQSISASNAKHVPSDLSGPMAGKKREKRGHAVPAVSVSASSSVPSACRVPGLEILPMAHQEVVHLAHFLLGHVDEIQLCSESPGCIGFVLRTNGCSGCGHYCNLHCVPCCAYSGAGVPKPRLAFLQLVLRLIEILRFS